MGTSGLMAGSTNAVGASAKAAVSAVLLLHLYC